MRQVVITRYGGPEVLEVRESPDPTPGEGQVRVRVANAGLNFAEVMARMGLYPDAPKAPCVVGYEVAGTVDAVGKGARGFAEGDRVVALVAFGGHSDVVVVNPDQLVKVPANVTLEKAGALPVQYLTAWAMLVTLGNVQPGDQVLVHAAAGGVGQAALQICKHKGAQVIGTASASKHERLRAAGVAHTIDYNTQDFHTEVMRLTGGRGVDIALDAVGGKSFAKSYDSLAPMGRLFVFGGSAFSSGKTRNIGTIVKAFFSMPSFKPMRLMSENRGVIGVNMGHLWNERARLRALLEEVVRLTAEGVLDPVIDKVYPFAEAGAAHMRLNDRQNFGKVLLAP
jgi:NADPH:quinone reductase-like Zn-dependent oxidoreductase